LQTQCEGTPADRAERTRINDLFRSGKLQDEARRRIEPELDLREAHFSNQLSRVRARLMRNEI
jgi:hypothetical protein